MKNLCGGCVRVCVCPVILIKPQSTHLLDLAAQLNGPLATLFLAVCEQIVLPCTEKRELRFLRFSLAACHWFPASGSARFLPGTPTLALAAQCLLAFFAGELLIPPARFAQKFLADLALNITAVGTEKHVFTHSART